MSETQSTTDKTARLPSALCWVALALFAFSLGQPALRVQGRGEWVAGDFGYQCAFLSLAETPCWVPNALLIAAPFVATWAGKSAQKVTGVVLGITTSTVLHVCIPWVAAIGSGEGLLPGFWLWAAALVTATAGLLVGGFSPVHTSQPGPSCAGASPRSRTRPRGAILLCWLALASVLVTRLVSLVFFVHRPFPQGFSRAISDLVLDEVVVPALLAMAPLACLYAGARTRRFMALALGFLGLVPFLSINRPAELPFEALAPLLVSYLTVALAAIGLLVSAGLMNRIRKAPAELAEPASAELPDRQVGTPEVGRAVAHGNPPLGAVLCWLALAHSLVLGSAAFRFQWIIGWPDPLALVWVIPHHRTLACSLLAMAPWVCKFSGPTARRILGALLALDALLMLRGIWWYNQWGLPVVIALCSSAAGLFWADVAARQRAE